MSLEWFAETIVSAAVTWIVFALMTWAWARRKVLPFLREHAPTIAAMLRERER